MAALFAFLLIVLIGGVAARVVLAARPKRPERGDQDVTDTSVRPPAHPDAPVPGSAPQRAEHGKP